MRLWESCDGAQQVGPLTLELVRVVESQEQIATLSLVDGLEEQALLEQLLEESKPGNIASNPHYLLASPFRYPPLKWGSRFGRAHERALFYASLNIETALTECAFYRLVFLSGLAVPFPRAVVTQHASFWVKAKTQRGVNLAMMPFAAHTDALRSPDNYGPVQAFGADMRDAEVELFMYLSARDKRASAMNAAALVPKVFDGFQPTRFQAWTCHASPDSVRYLSAPAVMPGRESFEFARACFLVDGRLPMPPSP